MLTLNMVGTGLATALIPLTLACPRPILWTWITLTVSGMFQGSLIPAHQDMKRHWLPVGAGRAVANRIIGIGLTLNSLLATSLTPFLAQRFGWRSVFQAYGGATLAFAVLWHWIATDAPDLPTVALPPALPEPGPEPESSKAVASPPPEEEAAAPEKTFEWRIFTVPAVLVAIGCKGTSGLPEYCLTQWLPTEFADRFGSTEYTIPIQPA